MVGLEERTDRELLKAFADVRNEAAFAELVRRHGSLVLGVCRRVLGRSADAENAAQAAFLVLAQRVSRGQTFHPVAPWLHRVGHGIAVNLLKKIGPAEAKRPKQGNPAEDLKVLKKEKTVQVVE